MEPPFIPPRPSLEDLLRGTEFEHWLAPPEPADEPPSDSRTYLPRSGKIGRALFTLTVYEHGYDLRTFGTAWIEDPDTNLAPLLAALERLIRPDE